LIGTLFTLEGCWWELTVIGKPCGGLIFIGVGWIGGFWYCGPKLWGWLLFGLRPKIDRILGNGCCFGGDWRG
jgi:hypothetical protein